MGIHSNSIVFERKATLAVFLPCYKHADLLPGAIDAILAQSRQPNTIYLLDDASPDNTREVIENYASKYEHIEAILSDENLGYNENANRLVSSLKEDYVYFASADDVILPNFFYRSMELLEKNPKAGLCSAISLYEDGNTGRRYTPRSPQISRKARYVSPAESYSFYIRNGSWLNGGTTIYRKTAILEFHGLNTSLHGLADNFLASMVSISHGCCFVPEEYHVWRRFDNSMAAQSHKNIKLSCSAIIEANKLFYVHFSISKSKKFMDRYNSRWAGSLMMYGDLGAITSSQELRDTLAKLLPNKALLFRLSNYLPPSLLKRITWIFIFRWFDIKNALRRRLG